MSVLPPLIVGPADKATVYLLFKDQIIKTPPVLSDNDRTIADLIKKHQINVDITQFARNLVKLTLPVNNPFLSEISGEISSHIIMDCNLFFVNLKQYDIDVNVFFKLLTSIHENTDVNITIDEITSLRSLTTCYARFLPQFDANTDVDKWMADIRDNNQERISIWEDLFAYASNNFTVEFITETIRKTGLGNIFSSRLWSIVEDTIYEIMQELNKTIPNQDMYECIDLPSLSNKYIKDASFRLHPDIHQILCDRLDNPSYTQTKCRCDTVPLSKDYLAVLESKSETHLLNGHKYIRLWAKYPDAKTCAKFISQYIKKYKSFDQKKADCYFLRVGLHEKMVVNGTPIRFSNISTFVGIKDSDKIEIEHNTGEYCVYVRDD